MLSGIAPALDNLVSLDLVLLRLAMARSDGVRCAPRADAILQRKPVLPLPHSRTNTQSYIVPAKVDAGILQLHTDLIVVHPSSILASTAVATNRVSRYHLDWDDSTNVTNDQVRVQQQDPAHKKPLNQTIIVSAVTMPKPEAGR